LTAEIVVAMDERDERAETAAGGGHSRLLGFAAVLVDLLKPFRHVLDLGKEV
jgi:hypothetical protein